MKTYRYLMLGATVGPTLLGLLAATAGDARAADTPGQGFQSMVLSATAGGLQVSGDGLAGQPPGSAAAGVPLASAQLTRSSGHGLASVAWPGSLAANAGSLLLLLGPSPCVPGDDPVLHQPVPVVGGLCDEAAPIPQPVMDNYHYLNSPVRAEAQYPTTPHSDQAVPGARMVADASAARVSAEAQVGGGTTTEGLTFGTATASSALQATGPQAAKTQTSSTTQNLSIAAGVVTIASVTSQATATTTGTTATATGGTTVSGMQVAGIPVSVDGKGLHVQGNTADTSAALDAVTAALSGAGIRMYATAPTKQVQGGYGRFHAGTLVIVWDVDQAGPKDDIVMILGGADATATATLPYLVTVPGVPPVASVPGSSPVGVGTGQPGFLAGPGSSFAPPSTASAGTPDVSLPGTFGLVPVSLTGPLAVGWIVLWAAGGALVAVAGRRLPDRILSPEIASRCVNGVLRRVE